MRAGPQIMIGIAALTVGAIAYSEISSSTPTRAPVRAPVRPSMSRASTRMGTPTRRAIRNPLPVSIVAEAPEVVGLLEPTAGLAVEDGRIVITSYDAWMRYAPQAIETALADGARGTDGILIHVMRRALPRLRWPPEPGSRIAEQWPQMLQQVAEKLGFNHDPEPSRVPNRLRLL